MPSREPSGTDELAVERDRAVFINCPFDPEFSPLQDAIVFAVACCGFIPRSAIESGTVSEPRMERVMRAIFTSKYSIHDLSRYRGEGSDHLARFNMPLELGIAMACRFASVRKKNLHDWLLLVPEGHLHHRFISDLSAWDPKPYDGNVTSLVPHVVSWLATRPEAVNTPTPKQVLDALPHFQASHERLRDRWGAEIPWWKLVAAARESSRRIDPLIES